MFFDERAYRQELCMPLSSIGRIVYAVEFNNDASFLAAGTSRGQVALFDLHAAAAEHSVIRRRAAEEHEVEHMSFLPMRFDTTVGAINDMHSEGSQLYCGTDEGVLMCAWDKLIAGNIDCSLLRMDTQDSPNNRQQRIEVNAITGMPGSGSLFMATGDGNAYSFSLDNAHQPQGFKGSGSAAYLHCITMCGENQPNVFLTGAENGDVCLFDKRCGGDPQHVFKPGKKKGSSWIGALTANSDGNFTIVADGAGNLYSVHVPTGDVVASAKLPFAPAVLRMANDEVYCGGADGLQNQLLRFNIECESRGHVDTSASGTYAMAIHPITQVAASAGYSVSKNGYSDTREIVDVYLALPLRSFSMAVT